MSFSKTLMTAAVALSLAAASGSALAGDKSKGKALGQDFAPGQSASQPGQGTAPGQTDTKRTHPDNFGAIVSSKCASMSDPKLKDDCVRDEKSN